MSEAYNPGYDIMGGLNTTLLPNQQQNQGGSNFLSNPLQAAMGAVSSFTTPFTGAQSGLKDRSMFGSETEFSQYLQNQDLMQKLNPGFNWSEAFDIGMSTFNDITKYNQNKDMMGLYKQDLGKKWADQDRRDATRAKWSSAFQNA